ncbi:hypothetical protein ACLBOM_37500 [Escherichia coli]
MQFIIVQRLIPTTDGRRQADHGNTSCLMSLSAVSYLACLNQWPSVLNNMLTRNGARIADAAWSLYPEKLEDHRSHRDGIHRLSGISRRKTWLITPCPGMPHHLSNCSAFPLLPGSLAAAVVQVAIPVHVYVLHRPYCFSFHCAPARGDHAPPCWARNLFIACAAPASADVPGGTVTSSDRETLIYDPFQNLSGNPSRPASDVKKLAGKLEDGRQAVLFDREKNAGMPGQAQTWKS